VSRFRGHSGTLAQARATALTLPVQGVFCRLGLRPFADDLEFRPSFTLGLRGWPPAEQALDLLDQFHARSLRPSVRGHSGTLAQPSDPCHNRLVRIALATTALALGLAAPALAATQSRHFQFRVGQTRTFAAARTGDRITCSAGRHSVTVVVPQRHVAVFKQTTVTPTRRLAINLGRKTDGRVWALCRWR
jgi:hypothetical protein